MIDRTTKLAFSILILAQAAHSLEEYWHRLYEVLAPARFFCGLVSSDLQMGFVVINSSVVAAGVLCYLLPVRLEWKGAVGIVLFWCLFEGANGLAHLAWSLGSATYQPGAATAPILLVTACWLGLHLARSPQRST